MDFPETEKMVEFEAGMFEGGDKMCDSEALDDGLLADSDNCAICRFV